MKTLLVQWRWWWILEMVSTFRYSDSLQQASQRIGRIQPILFSQNLPNSEWMGEPTLVSAPSQHQGFNCTQWHPMGRPHHSHAQIRHPKQASTLGSFRQWEIPRILTLCPTFVRGSAKNIEFGNVLLPHCEPLLFGTGCKLCHLW